MGILEFGLVFNAYLSVNNASREGAREAALGGLDSDIRSAVQRAAPTLEILAGQILIDPNQTTRSKGDAVTVTVDYTRNHVTSAKN